MTRAAALSLMGASFRSLRVHGPDAVHAERTELHRLDAELHRARARIRGASSLHSARAPHELPHPRFSRFQWFPGTPRLPGLVPPSASAVSRSRPGGQAKRRR
ncbi:hypothetical protein GCM10018965_048850 [Nonomuraea roseola]